jgi:hypothetical protein
VTLVPESDPDPSLVVGGGAHSPASLAISLASVFVILAVAAGVTVYVIYRRR